jgi:hypothetical protein
LHPVDSSPIEKEPMRTATLVWSLLLAWPGGLAAQREVEPAFPAAEDTLVVTLDSKSPEVGTLLLAATAGMLTGAFGGGLIGIQIDGDNGLDDADGAVIGGLVGTSLLIPTAVHLADGRRGNLGRSILVSTVVGGAMLAAGVAAESGEIILAIPLVQLISSVFIERDTGR